MTNSRRTLTISLSITLVAVLIVVSLLYFLVWRPKDSSYQTATNQLKTLQTDAKGVRDTLGYAQTANDVADPLLTGIVTSASKFDIVLKAFSANAVLSDQTVKSVYDKYKAQLTSYDTSALNTSSAMKLYVTVAGTCNYLFTSKAQGIKTVADFDSASISCNQTLGAAQATGDSPFKTRFLSDYINLLSGQVASYRQQVAASTDTTKQVAATGAIANTQKDIATLTTTSLNLRPDDMTNAIKDLQNIVSTQSKAFLR